MKENIFIEEDILIEESAQLHSEDEDFFLRAARLCLLVVVALLPVWFLPTTIAPVLLNKVFFFSITFRCLGCYRTRDLHCVYCSDVSSFFFFTRRFIW